MSSIELTDASKTLFMELWQDLGNWGEEAVLVNGNVEISAKRRGNLTDLIKKGLVSVDDVENETWVSFTPNGVEYAGISD